MRVMFRGELESGQFWWATMRDPLGARSVTNFVGDLAMHHAFVAIKIWRRWRNSWRRRRPD